jgi:hypothetical protein
VKGKDFELFRRGRPQCLPFGFNERKESEAVPKALEKVNIMNQKCIKYALI